MTPAVLVGCFGGASQQKSRLRETRGNPGSDTETRSFSVKPRKLVKLPGFSVEPGHERKTQVQSVKRTRNGCRAILRLGAAVRAGLERFGLVHEP